MRIPWVPKAIVKGNSPVFRDTSSMMRIGRMAIVAAVAGMACTGRVAQAVVVNMGTTAGYAMLSAAGVTSTGATVINGDIGLSPLTTLTGSPVVNGVVHANDTAAIQAMVDAQSAYAAVALLTYDANLSGQDLGGQVLTPGVYHFANSAQLTGNLTLDGLGQENPSFIFQIGSTLTTAAESSILIINGAYVGNIIFQVGSSATLGIGTDFLGIIIANQSNTLTTGATVQGGVFALNGAVTLDGNTVGAVPEPATAGLMVLGMLMILTFRRPGKTAASGDSGARYLVAR